MRVPRMNGGRKRHYELESFRGAANIVIKALFARLVMSRAGELLCRKNPPALTSPQPLVTHLSILLGRAVPTLQTDRCRRPWALPAWPPPGAKSPIWLLS